MLKQSLIPSTAGLGAYVMAAFRALLPQLAALKAKARPPKDKRKGVLYVLHDGVTGLSKIGCTAGEGRRQRSQTASHGMVLVMAVVQIMD